MRSAKLTWRSTSKVFDIVFRTWGAVVHMHELPQLEDIDLL